MLPAECSKSKEVSSLRAHPCHVGIEHPRVVTDVNADGSGARRGPPCKSSRDCGLGNRGHASWHLWRNATRRRAHSSIRILTDERSFKPSATGPCPAEYGIYVFRATSIAPTMLSGQCRCSNSLTTVNPMTRSIPPPSEPPISTPKASEGALLERDCPSVDPGVMHGRMLQVSRLATIGEMAAGVAHELNQPLTAIANYAQACDRLLSRPAPNLEDVRTAMREIAGQAVRAGDILRRLRSLAQSQPMRLERADLNAAIDAIRDLILADGRVHRARVQFELSANLPPVSIDTVQLQHVILNLVRNGLEAPAEAGAAPRELTVCTGLAPDGDVEITVRDNGPGLSPQAVERMFDPFFSTKPEGTGLGLAISNTVVRAHGGSLTYRANSPCGACFAIRLPAES